MFKLKPILLSSSLLICLAMSNAISAIEYQIELIVFEHLNSSASLEGVPRIDTDKNYPSLRKYKSVPRENLQLTDQASQIRGSRNFHLVKHIAWAQEGLSKKDARSVDLADMIPEAEGIQGTLTVHLSRYLHLEVFMEKQIIGSDVVGISDTGTNATNLEGAGINDAGIVDPYAYMDTEDDTLNYSHIMQESRRMRSNETHYIDHPYFGILARITPIETDVVDN